MIYLSILLLMNTGNFFFFFSLGTISNSAVIDILFIFLVHCWVICHFTGFLDGSVVMNLPSNTEEAGLIPESGRFPGKVPL